MSAISVTFGIKDRFSSVMKTIMGTSDKAAKHLEDAGSAADKVADRLEKTGKAGKTAQNGLDNTGKGADRAGKKLDNLNNKLKKTKTAAERVAETMEKVFAATAVINAGKSVANAADSYANANTRLGLINTSNDPNLQNKVYASAQRSRSSYESTAGGIASLGLNASSAFKNTDEIIAFVESINKQFAIAGTSAAAAEGAMIQLTQAMGSGALRGDELNSVLESAPSIARNIEKYMGWAEGSIKSYAEQGKLTAEVVKNAQLAMLDSINGQFKQMPMTWAQVWTSAMNIMQKAASPLLGAISAMASHVDIILPVLAGLATAYAGWAVATYGATAAQWALTTATAAWNAIVAAGPLAWGAAALGAFVVALNLGVAVWNAWSGSAVSAAGLVGGAISVVISFVVNLLSVVLGVATSIIAAVAVVSGNMVTAFQNSIINIQAFFYDLLATATAVIGAIAEKLNALPFVNIDTSALSGAADTWSSKASSLRASKGSYTDVGSAVSNVYDSIAGGAFKKGWASDAWGSGYSKGEGLASKISSYFSGGSGSGLNLDSYSAGSINPVGTDSNPATVTGTGSNGAVTTSLEDEDIDYLKELAERDYVARIAQNTLAPNIAVTFTGDIHKEADYEQLGPAIAQILQDELEVAPEGLY